MKCHLNRIRGGVQIMKIKLVDKLFWAAVLACVSVSAHAVSIRVSQESSTGAGDFDLNVLGSITAFESTGTAAAYYDYGTIPASFNDGLNDVTLTSNKSHAFFVNGSDGLSAFFVHDKPNDGLGGMAGMTFDLLGDTASVLVRDDPGEGVTATGGTNFVSNHNWVGCCTDGLVLGSLDDNWTLYAEFDRRSWSDFTGWLALGDGGSIDLAGDLDRRVRFDLAPVPVPAAVWLFGTALVGFVGYSRRRKLA